MTYTTRQRTLLHQFLSGSPHAHISIREILDFARKEGIGVATVYRYLDKLTREGQLYKYNHGSADDGGTCYQWHDKNCQLYHFICTDCGKCFHLECGHLCALDSHISAQHAFEVDLSQTVFRGRCATCVGKETI